MDSLLNQVKRTALGVGEMLTPVLKESKFKETGVLTPEEFLTAGDHLVHHCPTWHWEKAANPAGIKDYLPAEKQFLITRRVPCHRRCLDMDYDPGLEKIIHGGDANEDPQDEWVDTHHFATDTAQVSAAAEPEKASAAPGKPVEDEPEEDDDAPPMDMDAFMESGALEEDDPNRYVPPKTKQNTSEGSQVPGNADDNILRTRTYDLHITYDKYYQVPRLWLAGYDEKGKPLTVEQMNEDFSQDHANKTITIESHPHLNGIQMASIHPCKHAEVMKRLMEQLADNGKDLEVQQYLLIFLKFVQAVIPTIEYDYTRSIQL